MLTSVAPVPAAGPAPPSADRIRDLEQAIGEASAEEAAALRELATIRSRRAELDASLAALDAQITAAEAAVAAHRAEVDRLLAAISQLDREIARTSRQLDDARGRAEESAADLYVSRVGGPPVQVGLVEADSVRDAYVGALYLSRVSSVRWAEVDELAGLKETIEQLEAAVERQRSEAEAARRAAEDERTQLANLRATHAREREAVAIEEQRERALVESIRARKDQFAAELATLQASSNAITELLAARQRGQVRAASFSAARPVPGAVTSGFGPRVHPVLGTSRMHNGVDMSAGHGAPIKAAAPGVVAFAGVRDGYGNTIIVDHGNQYATLYAHASSLSVIAGQRVETGQTVALVGATGLATGPHLHFEVRLLGVPVNPLDSLRR